MARQKGAEDRLSGVSIVCQKDLAYDDTDIPSAWLSHSIVTLFVLAAVLQLLSED